MKRISNNFIASLAFAALLIAFATANVSAQKRKPTKAAATKVGSAVSEPENNAANVPVAPPPELVAPTPAPAKPSRARICVAAPKTNLQPSETAPESLRNSLVKYLSGPAAEIVPLDTLVQVQQQAEAEEKGCAFYLAVSVTQKKTGGGEGFGNLLKKGSNAAPLFDNLGSGKMAQTVSKAARVSQTKMTTAGDLAAGIKAKDEVTLEYKLFNAQNAQSAAAGKIKTKAGKDGEDVLSPLLEQSVNDILSVAVKK